MEYADVHNPVIAYQITLQTRNTKKTRIYPSSHYNLVLAPNCMKLQSYRVFEDRVNLPLVIFKRNSDQYTNRAICRKTKQFDQIVHQSFIYTSFYKRSTCITSSYNGVLWCRWSDDIIMPIGLSWETCTFAMVATLNPRSSCVPARCDAHKCAMYSNLPRLKKKRWVSQRTGTLWIWYEAI